MSPEQLAAATWSALPVVFALALGAVGVFFFVAHLRAPKRCPQSHPLARVKWDEVRDCDHCGKVLPGKTRHYGCKRCNYDICGDCGAKSTEQLRHDDEERELAKSRLEAVELARKESERKAKAEVEEAARKKREAQLASRMKEVKAPLVNGDDPEMLADIDGISSEVYSGVTAQREADRREREQAEDKSEDHKVKLVQPVKEKRFKLYIKYEGRMGRAAWVKIRLPRRGEYEDGPSIAIKKLFVNWYNRNGEVLSVGGLHLRSEIGISIPDEDALSGYVGYGGLVYVADGSSPSKLPEHAVYFWGANGWSDPQGDSPLLVSSLQRKRICQVTIGREHCMALGEGGRAFAWGKNDFGQLGTGDEVDRLFPVHTELPYDTNLRQIACGGAFSLALTKRGELWSWGRFQASNFPRLFADTWCNGYESKGEMGIKQLKLSACAAGDQHMGVLSKEGKLYTWGYNDFGQLGWGLHGSARVGQQKPQQVTGPLSEETVIDFALGGGHSVAITKSCRVFAWGSNTNGQLGHAMKQCFPEPVEIPLGMPVAKVRAGWQCTVYITDGARPIVCGGIRAEGPTIEDAERIAQEQAAEGDAPALPPREQRAGGGPEPDSKVMSMVSTGMDVMQEVVTEAAVGEAHGLLVCYDGSVRGWGYNRQAQAIGAFSEETFVELQEVQGLPEGFSGHGCAVGGSQSYVILKPSGS